jgi:hypothetical protein
MLRDILNNYGNATAIHATYAISDGLDAPRIARIARVQVASPITTDLSGSGEVISNWWLVHYTDIENVQVAIWPPCTHAEVLALNPNALDAEPIPSPVPLEVMP